MPEAIPKPTNVSTPSAVWSRLERLREKCRDVLEGVDKLREKAETYLPRTLVERPFIVPITGQQFDPWLARVNASSLDNYYRTGVADAVGRVWSKAPKIDETTPEDLVAFLDDVDGRGSAVEVFGAARSVESVSEGASFVLVDYPQVGGEQLSRAEARKLGLSPIWKAYPARTVIGWDLEVVRGKERPKVVRLRESFVERGETEWDTTTGEQIRVLRAGLRELPEGMERDDPRRFARSEIWREVEDENGRKKWVEMVEMRTTLSPQIDIPLVEWPTDSTAPFECPPPYYDVAVLNIAHYQLKSILETAMKTILPFIHWSGCPVDDKGQPKAVSFDRMFLSPNEAAKMAIHEVTGAAWESIEGRLAKMAEQMMHMTSSAYLAQQWGDLSAMGEALRFSGMSARLGVWRMNWQDALANLLYFTAVYMEVVEPEAEDGWGGIELNADFFPKGALDARVKLESQKLLREAGVLSAEGLFESAQRDEIVPSTLDFKTEKARVSREMEGLPTSIGETDDEDEDDENAEIEGVAV